MNLLVKALLFLLPACLGGVEIIAPSSTSLQVGTEFYAAVNVSNGSGLSTTPTAGNYQSVTHSAASGSSAWTTNAPGGGSSDYYNFAQAPVFLFTFDETHDFSDLVYWGYHFGNPNGNEGKSFRLEFSQDGGDNFSQPVNVTSPAISASSATTLPLGGVFSANTIRLTITDNWFEDYGGGDRVGIGEFRFLGETPIDPSPRIAVDRLLDFGINPITNLLTLTIRNSGIVDDLVVTPALDPASGFSTGTSPLTIPAESSTDLVLTFTPPADGCYTGILNLLTNDPAAPEVQVTLLAGINCTFPSPTKPEFSQADGVFSDAFQLTLTTDGGATILYTLDGSIPGEESGLVYNGPITIDSSVQVRAASYLPGNDPAIRSRSYLKLAGDLASYSSELPIMVVDNFNAGSIPNKGWSTSTQTGAGLRQVARQPAFFSVFDRQTNNPANFQNPPSQTSRIGIRVRGAFSSTWTPKPYALETWKTDANEDRTVKILGMASESDWILYYPHPGYDRTMLYNTFIWELSRQTGRWAPEFRFVDLFVNEDGGDLSLADRRGVYVFLEKPKRDPKRLEFDELSADGTTGGFLTSINRMDAIPVEGYPAENGATSPQFFHTAGPNRIQSTPPNIAGSGDDIPRQYNAFINFENPNGYRITATQRAAVEGWFRTFEDALYDNEIWQDPEIGYRKHLDTTDFIDYMQMLTLAKQGDGLLLSMYPWVSSHDRKLRMGPMWDFNNGAYSGSTTGTLYFRPDRLWYGRLFDDPGFQREYEDRWFELREGPLSNANMAAIIDAQTAEITTGLAGEQSGLSAGSWITRVNTMKSWLQSRANWIDSNFLPPPTFSSAGGVVPPDFALTITSNQSGSIYYSLDGSDPIDSLLVYNSPITPPRSVEIAARVRTANGSWSALRKATFVVDHPASSENLIVSEINYHPADDFPDTEFIELMNISNSPIDLTNASFTAGIAFTFPPNTVLASGERILVVEDEQAMNASYGPSLPIAGEFAGLTKLANSGEQITLTAADGSIIFDFEYQDADPWPEFADGGGCSLTLIQPTTRPDLSSGFNWRCSSVFHGTPAINDALTFTGTLDELTAFVLGRESPLLSVTPEGPLFEFQIQLAADGFIVAPESSPDLVNWQPLQPPSQPSLINGNGTATFRVPLDAISSKQFLRLKITSRP